MGNICSKNYALRGENLKKDNLARGMKMIDPYIDKRLTDEELNNIGVSPDPVFEHDDENDPIPREVKMDFFTDKTMPDLINDYDAIGFDVEHTLVKFNQIEMNKHLIKAHALLLK